MMFESLLTILTQRFETVLVTLTERIVKYVCTVSRCKQAELKTSKKGGRNK